MLSRGLADALRQAKSHNHRKAKDCCRSQQSWTGKGLEQRKAKAGCGGRGKKRIAASRQGAEEQAQQKRDRNHDSGNEADPAHIHEDRDGGRGRGQRLPRIAW